MYNSTKWLNLEEESSHNTSTSCQSFHTVGNSGVLRLGGACWYRNVGSGAGSRSNGRCLRSGESLGANLNGGSGGLGDISSIASFLDAWSYGVCESSLAGGALAHEVIDAAASCLGSCSEARERACWDLTKVNGGSKGR